MLVLLAIMMVLFMVIAGVAINIAKVHLARTELRTSTNAAAKAAAEALSRTQNPAAAIARGSEIAAANPINGEPLRLRPSDFRFGHSQPDRNGRFVFNPVGRPLNSVRVAGEASRSLTLRAVPLAMGGRLPRAFFEPRQFAVATYVERDIVLVVDCSESMQGSKFTDVQTAIDIFLKTLAATPLDEQVGLASCSEQATVDVSLTRDLSLVSTALSQLRPEGSSSIARGMTAGASILHRGHSRDFVERTMIVMTDGLDNAGSDLRSVAGELAANGVVIHTITFDGAADPARMRAAAGIGRGRHFHADDGLELQRICRELALTLSTMTTE